MTPEAFATKLNDYVLDDLGAASTEPMDDVISGGSFFDVEYRGAIFTVLVTRADR